MFTLSSVFKNEFDRYITINEYADRVIILKNIDAVELDKVRTKLKQYYKKAYLEKIRIPDQRKCANKKSNLILAFSYSSRPDDTYINFRRISLPILKKYFGYSPINPNSNFIGNQYISATTLYEKHIQVLSRKEQQSLLNQIIKAHGNEIFKYGNKTEAFPSLLTDSLIDLMITKGVEYIFNELLRLNNERQYFYKKFMKLLPPFKEGTVVQLRQTLTLISMELHKQGLLLLPFLWMKNQWLDYSDSTLFKAASQFMTPEIKEVLLLYKEEELKKDDSIYSVIGLFLCSNIASYKDYTPKLEYIMINAAKHGLTISYSEQVKKHLNKLQKTVNLKPWKDYDPVTANINFNDLEVTKVNALSSIYKNEFAEVIMVNEHLDRVIVLGDIKDNIIDKIGSKIKQNVLNKTLDTLRDVDFRTSYKNKVGDYTILAFSVARTYGQIRSYMKIDVLLLKEFFGYSKTAPNYSSDNTISLNDLHKRHIALLSIKAQQFLYDKLRKIYGTRLVKFNKSRDNFSFNITNAIIRAMKEKGVEYVFDTLLKSYRKPSFFKKYALHVLGQSYGPNCSIREFLRIMALFSMMLHKEGLILMPFPWIKYSWNDDDLFKAASKAMSKSIINSVNSYKTILKQLTKQSMSEEIYTIIGIFLCSNITTHKGFTPKLKFIILEIGYRLTANTYYTTLKTHLNRFKLLVLNTEGMSDWIEYHPKTTEDTFIYLNKDYKEHPEFIEWIKLGNIYLNDKAKSRKSISEFSSTISHWLKFLGTLEKPPLHPTEVSRQTHIRNIINYSDIKLFYNYVEKIDKNAKGRNLILRRMENFFDFLRDSLFPNLQTIIVANDKFYMGGQRTKTARKRIPSSILSIAKMLLLEDLSYIKQYSITQIIMYNQKTNKLEKIYWPGYQHVMTILLFLPLRNKQARWLDSGELDEFIIDYKTMQYIKNPSEYAIKGRKSCVLQIEIDEITGEKHFVIYVPTNKTGSPYIIPYAPKEVIESIKFMQKFNKEWTNPMTVPIKAVDRKGRKENQNSELYPDICPIFKIPRDTIDGYFSPLNDENLRFFYIKLLESIEAVIKDEGKNISLTIHSAKGNYKRPIFDIHSLRVTGISELIDAGVPIDIVSEFVAGHANQVMTLYYHVQKHSRVRESLETARKSIDTQHSIQNIITDLDNFEEYFLVNELDGDKEYAINMLADKDSFYEIGFDGICPGASCDSVGREDQCCPKCPVWITGPAFLVGQTIKINKLIYRIRKIAEQLASCRKERIEENNPLRKQNLSAKEEHKATLLKALLTEWGLRYRFIQRSTAIADDYEKHIDGMDSVNGMALITKSSKLPTIQLEESDELGILNHICQSGLIFEEESVPEAQYDLEYLLNQLLQKNGIYPFLVLLDKEAARRTSLMLVDGLLARYNTSELLEMIHGDKSLKTEDVEYISSHINDSKNTMIKNTIYLEEQHD